MVLNARRDPTRTTGLRRRFVAEVNRRFRRLKAEVRKFVVDEDELALKGRTDKKFARRAGLTVLQRRFEFRTDAQKLAGFKSWLQDRVDEGVLVVEGPKAEPWTSKYVQSAYRQGVVRSFIESNKENLLMQPGVFEGTQEQFLIRAFAAPETTAKLQLLTTRAFEELKGVTATMSQQLGRHLADGLANGWGPIKIARQMQNSIDSLTRTRARMIARTETIHAHAEGQLDSFEMLGVKDVGVMAEWLTAGDALVCEQCASLEGRTYKIDEARGMLPTHPNCRCCWLPATKETK